MIRSYIFRNSLLKSSLNKDMTVIKGVRCFTIVCRPNRKKLTFSIGKRSIIEVEPRRNNFPRRFYAIGYPIHEKVTLPALSPTMEFGTIISWEKKEGDKLNEGDLLAEIETDKAVIGFEASTEGFLAKIVVPAGTKNIPIGKLICIIVKEEHNIAAFKDYVDTESFKPAAVAYSPPKTTEPEAQSAQTAHPSPTKPGGRIYASPLARRLAAAQRISLKTIGKGSGLYGSITSQDLSKARGNGKENIDGVTNNRFVDVPVTNIQYTSANRFIEFKQKIPHYYLSVDINADEIIVLKEKLNAVLPKDDFRISLFDLIIKAVALSCKKVPEANSSWQETFIRQYNTVDVSIAVHTDQGIFTPIIFDADLKGILAISTEIRSLSVKAREGKLQPSEYDGGTIGVTNLSSYGVKNFTAIINPSQACVLSVGATEEKLVADNNNPNGFRTTEVLPLTLSCDHRVLDGAVGAKWLGIFRKYIENPSTMML